MEILSSLDYLSPNDNRFSILISELDIYIKQNEEFRRNTPIQFFTILHRNLLTFSQSDQKNWCMMRHLLKCLKNSAASIKSEFSFEECQICDQSLFLLDYESLQNSENNDLDKFHFNLNILQYIFNLVQGNNKALEKKSAQWTNLALSLIVKQNMDHQVYDISSMIIIKISENKKNREEFFQNLSSAFSFLNFINLVEYIEERFKNESLLDKFSNWTFKLLDKIFDFIYSKYIIESQMENFSNKFRYFIIYHINDRLMDPQEFRVQTYYINFKSLEFLCRIYTSIFKDLLSIFDQILDKTIDEVLNLFKQVKLITGLLSDFLTLKETKLSNNQMVTLVQNQNELFELTCHLFKEINCNNSYLELVDKYSNSTYSEILSLKCDLVRVIGILVYENEFNQNYLVKDQLLHIIAKNLNLDVDNPFMREWSIIALKHILCQLDKK